MEYSLAELERLAGIAYSNMHTCDKKYALLALLGLMNETARHWQVKKAASHGK